MNVSDFAGKIKAKYPQYNNLSDYDLTQKMLAKYPQYKSQVQVTPEDKVTGLPKALLDVSQGAGDAARSVGLGIAPDMIASSGPMQQIQKLTGINPMLKSSEQNRLTQSKIGNSAAPTLGAVGQDLAGAVSWMLPAGKLVQGAKAAIPALDSGVAGIVTSLLGHGATGAARGELYGMSQGKNPIEALPSAGVGAVAEPLLAGAKAALPFLTKGGVAGKSTQAAQKATQAGKSMNFDDLATQIRKEVFDQFGKTTEVKKAVDKLISGLTPPYAPGESTAATGATQVIKNATPFEGFQGKASNYIPPPEGATATGIKTQFTPQADAMQSQSGSLTPSDLLKTRRQITARAGGNFFKKALMGEDINDKVANAARRVISQSVHKLAPGTILPDKLYSLYSNKLIGSPAQMGLEAALGYLLGPKIAKTVGGAMGQ